MNGLCSWLCCCLEKMQVLLWAGFSRSFVAQEVLSSVPQQHACTAARKECSSLKNKKGSALILAGVGADAAPPLTADNEMNDLHSQLWCLHVDVHRHVRWEEKSCIASHRGGLHHIRHKSPLSAGLFGPTSITGPLLPGYTGNYQQPSCTEIRQIVLKLHLQNDLGAGADTGPRPDNVWLL